MALLAVAGPRARALEPGIGECLPPRSVVALLPLADRTDGAWTAWTGQSPALLVARLLADSLAKSQRREVLRLGPAARAGAGRSLARPLDDDVALRAARGTPAEIVASGSVDVFSHEEQHEPGRMARWGMGAPDARSRVRVSVTLRVLDPRDGTVIIETTAARDRSGRSVASVARPERDEAAAALDPLLLQILGEVVGDLTRTLGQRLEGRWKARVLSERGGLCVLDAGAARGVFAGERLDVWRPGIQILDEDLARLGDDVWVGSVVVTALQGKARARARLADGEVHSGDIVRPCSQATAPAISLRRQ